MTLKEIRGDSVIIHKDDEKLNQGEWIDMLGISREGFRAALLRQGITGELVLKRSSERLTRVGDFPEIVAGLKEARGPFGNPPNPFTWVEEVDTTRNFQITPPSGSTLIYEYPRSHTIVDFVRNAINKMGRR